MLMCVMNGPCPYQAQTGIRGMDRCVLEEGDCEYQMLMNKVYSSVIDSKRQNNGLAEVFYVEDLDRV